MRRILVAVFGAVFGTTLLVGLKSQAVFTPAGAVAGAPQDPGALAGGDPAAVPGEASPEATLAPGAIPGAPPAPGTTPRPGQTTSAPGQSTTTRPPTGGTTTTAPPPTTTTTVTGIAVAVRTARTPTTKSSNCGDCHDYAMSVTITVSGGRITKATVSYSTPPGSSLSYASKAQSTLSAKILTAQTWNLGRVTSATYSGNAWELSVRDAMSKAGLPT